jgi:hypothetical protein
MSTKTLGVGKRARESGVGLPGFDGLFQGPQHASELISLLHEDRNCLCLYCVQAISQLNECLSFAERAKRDDQEMRKLAWSITAVSFSDVSGNLTPQLARVATPGWPVPTPSDSSQWQTRLQPSPSRAAMQSIPCSCLSSSGVQTPEPAPDSRLLQHQFSAAKRY